MKKNHSDQLEFGFVNWGGKRRGAGRKPKGARAGVTHEKRARMSGREPVSVTLRFVEGLLTLRGDDTHELLVQSMIASSSAESFQVCHYSVQTSRVGPGRCRPGPPTDPDVRNSRIRLLGLAGSLRAA